MLLPSQVSEKILEKYTNGSITRDDLNMELFIVLTSLGERVVKGEIAFPFFEIVHDNLAHGNVRNYTYFINELKNLGL